MISILPNHLPCACGCGGVPRTQRARYLRGHHRYQHDPIEGRYHIDADSCCWVWQGHHYRSGYGLALFECKTWAAHRLARLLRYKILPPRGFHLHHQCGRRDCVNPDHLEPLTPVAHRGRSKLKLNEERVATIHVLRANGRTYRAIAEQMDVTASAIYQVVNGKIWAAVGHDGARRPNIRLLECQAAGPEQERLVEKSRDIDDQPVAA